MTAASAAAGPHFIASSIDALRKAGHTVSEPVARDLYSSGKRNEEVTDALAVETKRCKMIASVCEARGVHEIKDELVASGLSVDAAMPRIEEAQEIKQIVALAGRNGAFAQDDPTKAARVTAEFLARRVTASAARDAVFREMAAFEEATAIIGRAPRSHAGSSREDNKARMRRTLKAMGMDPKE